jgi:hypothetical protein
MPGRLAGLTTRGRCLLATGVAAALCAVLLNERDLLRVAAFAIMLPLLASVIVGYTRIRLRAEQELLPSRIAVSGDCQMRLALHGTGALSGRVLLEDVMPQALGGSRADHRSPRSGGEPVHPRRAQPAGRDPRGGAADRVARRR